MDFAGISLSWLELIGTISGLVGVWLTIKQNIWCFPIGMVNVALYTSVFFQSKLYGDASLQIVYLVLLAYGWFTWSKKDKVVELAVSRLNNAQYIISIVLLGVSTIGIYELLVRFTNSDIAGWDAVTTSISLLAQWLIARKKIENWLLWIVADVLYVGIYIHKELYFTTVLYFVFILLAIKGYADWRKTLKTKVA